MKLNEIQSADLVPGFLKSDNTVKGLCAVMDYMLSLISEKLPLANLYDNLESVSEKDLDYIAEKDQILWYDTSYEIDRKRAIIRGFETNCMFLGTKQAIEGVTADIFGMGIEEEWFEYGSKAFLFKITTNALLTPKTDDLVSKIVRYVKTAKSRLEYVEVQRNLQNTVYAGAAFNNRYFPADIVENLPKEMDFELIAYSSVGQISTSIPEHIREES